MTENTIDTTELCRHCLMCRHVAPVGQVTNNETYTPHGLAQIVASEQRGLIDWDRETAEAMYAASDNGNSRAHCVTDQPLPDALAAVRSNLADRDLAPEPVYKVGDRLREWENPFREETPEPIDGSGQVALFVGDEARYRSPGTLEAARTLLELLNIDPVPIGIGRNSGFLPNTLGLNDVATDLARTNLEELEATGAGRLILLGPGDYFSFDELYERRLNVPFLEEVECVELGTLLASALEDGRIRSRSTSEHGTTAYADPTHSVRIPSRFDAPRRLLESTVEGELTELFWRKERAFPAGNLGLEFVHPDIADQLTTARLEDAADRDIDRLFTEDPGTLYHLRQHRDAFNLEVNGLYEHLKNHLEST